jgi:hypothetical protein
MYLDINTAKDLVVGGKLVRAVQKKVTLN